MGALKRSCLHGKSVSTICFFVLALSGHGLFAAERPTMPTVAVFYGRPLPVSTLSRFDWVVVEPGNTEPSDLEALRRAQVHVFAYLSVGEARREEPVDPKWVLGTDYRWNTLVMDPAARGWRERVLEKAAALERQGYTGLFLDTLDSYAKALESPESRRARVMALVELCRALRAQHPGLELFFNRGFEILDEAGELAAGVAAESVFFGWDQAARRYVDVPEADRAWLINKLQELKRRLNIPAVALDYLPSSRSAEAQAVARRLEALGLVPWISTPELDQISLGVPGAQHQGPAIEAQEQLHSSVPRLLLLYDSAESAVLESSPIARLLAPHVRSLGFAMDVRDVRSGVPEDVRAAGYAGVVTWFTDDELPSALEYSVWLSRQIAAGVRVAIFGRPGFPASQDFLEILGLAAAEKGAGHLTRVERSDSLIGYEAQPRLRARELLWWRARSPEVRVHLRVEDDRGQWVDPVLTAPWGGLALQPYLVETGYQGRTRWIVDPGAFLSLALRVD
jgi:polysaccharide biosynthesis protein PelA